MLGKLKPFYVYTFNTFFNAGISFLVFSFLTHYLSAEDYGIINLYAGFSILITPFIGVGMQVMLGVDFFKLSKSEFKHQFVNAMALPVASTLLLTVLFVLLHKQIEELLHINTFFAITFPACCFMIIVSDIMLILMRDKGLHLGFAGFSITKNLVEIVVTVIFVFMIPLAWKGRLIGSNAALLAGLLISVYLVRRWRLHEGRFNKARFRENLRIGLPLVPERLAIFVFSFSDRFFIEHFSTVKDVGEYSAGAQVSVIVRLTIVTLITTFQPNVLRELARDVPNVKELQKQTLRFIVACAGTTLLMLAITPVVFHFFIGKEFKAGQYYAFFLTLGMFFSGMQTMFNTYLLFLKKNRLLMLTSMIGVVACCLLHYVNVSNFGPIGATYTSLAVYILISSITLYNVHRFYGLGPIFLGKGSFKNRPGTQSSVTSTLAQTGAETIEESTAPHQ
ncbi:MAG: lipopolysaccharide biosynthesis protein [Chitinophagaceae bacterium]|nr:MAG: lipopolysaccharide biosynthesis protein [Chitinophagaceae bacterium]